MPSSVIEKYYYEKETHTLIVVFVSGVVYRYTAVPEKVYHKMKNAFSKGIFLNKFIKGHYDFEKQGDE